jgi:hypothetical protein
MPKLSEVTGGKLKLSQVTDAGAPSLADRYAAAGLQAPRSQAEVDRAAYDEMPWYGRLAASTGAEFKSMGRGIGQLVTPNDSAVHQRLVAASDADAPYQDAQHGATNVAGRVLPYLATLPLGGEAAAGRGLLARVGLGAAEGAGYGALQETRTGESRTRNMLTGAGLGALGPTAARGLEGVSARAANAIKPEVRAIYGKANALGINLTPAQLSDSQFLKTLSSTLNKLPFSGGVSRAREQAGQWNRQLAGAIGVDAPVVTPEVYAAKKAADSAGFDALTARNNLTVTPELARNLHAISQQAKVAGVADAVNNAIDGLYSQMQDGVVPGRAYQALDSTLGKATKGGDTQAHFVGMVRDAIRNGMDASISPDDAAAWKQLRTEYGNRKTIAPLVAKGDGGPISPPQLMGRVTATKVGKERMASGKGGVMGDLAQVGQKLRDGVPDSGTAQRMLMYHGLGLLGGGYAATSDNPVVQDLGLLAAGGALGGRAINSNLLARGLMREGRGQVANRLARVAAQSPALTPLLLALMSQQQPVDAGNGP